MGLSYDMLERALVTITTGTDQDVDLETLEKVRYTVSRSAQKRSMPPILAKRRLRTEIETSALVPTG
jgi:hypothetical protein